jgi:hypothetical protein
MFNLSEYNSRGKEDQLIAYSPDKLKLNINNPDRLNIIAIENNQVVGFLFGVIERLSIANMFYVEWFGVDTKYKTKRIKLVDGNTTTVINLLWDHMEMFAKSKNLNGILGDSLVSNNKAINFGKHNGMNLWAEMKNHWYGQDYFLFGKFYG